MKNTIRQVFRSSKFVTGFIIFMIVFLLSLIWPFFATVEPLDMVGNKTFMPPGTYANVVDVIDNNNKNSGAAIELDLDVATNRLDALLDAEQREMMVNWLYTYGTVEEGTLSVERMDEVVMYWNEQYDFSLMTDLLTSEKNKYRTIDSMVKNVFSEQELLIQVENEEGELEEYDGGSNVVGQHDYVNISEIPNSFTFILGSDNFGRDMWTQLLDGILVSLSIGLIAGCVATAIGLVLGLLSGYLGGIADNIIMFITNLFTVIPSFVILILIANSLGSQARGVTMVAVIIGLTSWTWTCRSVRAQVLSLRNRDHVSISRLSGHSLVRIVTFDILPYLASYVVMAFILQISSGILAEAQLSMLGLGPATTEVATLGLMMNWATQFTAPQSGAWWAFFPVVFSIAAISFSLNLMNTGLDQVFNPQLRD